MQCWNGRKGRKKREGESRKERGIGLTCRRQFAYQLQRHTSKNVKFNIENAHRDLLNLGSQDGVSTTHSLLPLPPTLTDKDKACATVDSCCLPPFDGPFGLPVGQAGRQTRHHRVATVATWQDEMGWDGDVWRLLLQLDK